MMYRRDSRRRFISVVHNAKGNFQISVRHNRFCLHKNEAKKKLCQCAEYLRRFRAIFLNKTKSIFHTLFQADLFLTCFLFIVTQIEKFTNHLIKLKQNRFLALTVIFFSLLGKKEQ